MPSSKKRNEKSDDLGDYKATTFDSWGQKAGFYSHDFESEPIYVDKPDKKKRAEKPSEEKSEE